MPTIYEVEAANSPAGRALFAASGVSFDRPYWEAAFDGRVASRLYLDHPTEPSSGVLARTYDFFLAGETSTGLEDFLVDAPDAANLYQWFYGFVPLTAAWRDELPRRFPQLFREDRRAFRLSPEGYAAARTWKERLSSEIRMAPLDAGLAERCDADIPEVISILWDGYDTFARNGWGFVAIDGDGNLLSTAYAVGLTDREVNIGVGTAPFAQRRGLAKLVSQVCIAKAESLGLEMTWDCDLNNERSGKLAESLGFVEENPFVEYGFPDRATPTSNGNLWLRKPLDDGVIEWDRIEGES
ncbi:MAG: GNAT family N-acetyltransferase [Thermomicrobiales bacterium]